ncbi:hypothetical protein AB4Y85_11130 [Microvirga sp. 2YAF29]|uniref:hypothetical protein n=1 Tax=Microvirga sp. 2YAF29 TaxID=3233031 RepID=UPI003F9A91FE
MSGINGADLRFTGSAFRPACGVLDPVGEFRIALRHQASDFINAACAVGKVRAGSMDQLADGIFVAQKMPPVIS